MGRKKIDLTGLRFQRLIVLKYSHSDTRKSSYWFCKCDCGTLSTVRGSHLKTGQTQSCGCLNYQTKHGHARRCFKNKSTPTYNSWLSMRTRCLKETNKAYHYYGGRGITICKRWDKFENFLEDMGERPLKKSLDRINTNGDYEPKNCRWASDTEQARNKRGKAKGSSKYKGVIRIKNGDRPWRARIRAEDGLRCLGVYRFESVAARAYDRAAVALWGKDAYLNFDA